MISIIVVLLIVSAVVTGISKNKGDAGGVILRSIGFFTYPLLFLLAGLLVGTIVGSIMGGKMAELLSRLMAIAGAIAGFYFAYKRTSGGGQEEIRSCCIT